MADARKAREQEAAQRAEEQRRARVRAFVDSAQKAVQQFNALKLRTETGINYPEYRQKLGEVTDAVAAIAAPPNDDAAKAVERFRKALVSYNAAQEPWQKEASNRERMRYWGNNTTDQTIRTMYEDYRKDAEAAARKRLQCWQEGERLAREAREALGSLK